MRNKLDIMDELHGVIEALKISNQERQNLIDKLLKEGIEKDKKIKTIEQQLSGAEYIVYGLAKKLYLTGELKKNKRQGS